MTAYDNGTAVPGGPLRKPVLEEVVVPQGAAILDRKQDPLLGEGQRYRVLAGSRAVGSRFWSALYVLAIQAHYFGKSFKYTWDHLNSLWHFKAVPGIGPWMFVHYKVFEHIFMRDAPSHSGVRCGSHDHPEDSGAQSGYQKKSTPPLVDRIIVKLGMPSRIRGSWAGTGHLWAPVPDADPAMLLAAFPGNSW